MVNFKTHHLTESDFYDEAFLQSHFQQIYCSEKSSSIPLLLASSFHILLSLPVAALVPLCALEDSVMRSSQSSGSRVAADEYQDHCRNPWICEIALKSWGLLLEAAFWRKSLRCCLNCLPGFDLNLPRKVYQELK